MSELSDIAERLADAMDAVHTVDALRRELLIGLAALGSFTAPVYYQVGEGRILVALPGWQQFSEPPDAYVILPVPGP